MSRPIEKTATSVADAEYARITAAARAISAFMQKRAAGPHSDAPWEWIDSQDAAVAALSAGAELSLPQPELSAVPPSS